MLLWVDGAEGRSGWEPRRSKRKNPTEVMADGKEGRAWVDVKKAEVVIESSADGR